MQSSRIVPLASAPAGYAVPYSTTRDHCNRINSLDAQEAVKYVQPNMKARFRRFWAILFRKYRGNPRQLELKLWRNH